MKRTFQQYLVVASTAVLLVLSATFLCVLLVLAFADGIV